MTSPVAGFSTGMPPALPLPFVPLTAGACSTLAMSLSYCA